MILTWMIGSSIFGALVALAALAMERASAASGHARRWPWVVGLAAATLWPLIAGVTFVVRLGTSNGPRAATATTVSAVQAVTSRVPAIPAVWISNAEQALFVAWGVASLLLLARLAVGIWRLRRVEASGRISDVDGMQVVVTESIGPAVYGAFAPRILVPQWLLELDPPLRALVLAHEDQHRRRGDAALIVCGAIATALVPWNVAVWWMARRVRLAVELDCDARVVTSIEHAERYSRLLLLIAQRQSHTRLVPMLAESNAHLERRIAIMNSPRRSPSMSRATAFGAAAVGITLFACSSRVNSDVTSPQPMSANRAAGVQGDKVFFEFQVAKQVTEAEGSARPKYPDILKRAGVEGEVLAQYVVNQDGTPMEGSLRVLKSDHALLTQAVTDAFPAMRFNPAEVESKKVKQLVQQKFSFAMAGSGSALDKSAPDSRQEADKGDPKSVLKLGGVKIVGAP